VAPGPRGVPGAPAAPTAEAGDAIGEQVVAVPRDAVEIERRRSGRGEHHRVLRVHGHAGPRVRAAFQLVCVWRPRLVAELTGLRDRVEDPAELAAVHVERAGVPGRFR